jgi:Uncharacterized protein conserved in bacteria (DUF2219)
MRAAGALLGMALALAAVGAARAQTLDPRAALFAAPFAGHLPAPRSFAGLTAGAPVVIVSAPESAASPHPAVAIAFSQPAYLTAADEGAINLGDRSPLSLSGGGYDFTFVPQGAVDAGSGGASAQAGAMLRVGADVQGRVMAGLNKLGMHTVSGADLENRGRVYLFAAYSGREVGFNIARGSQGGLQRLGWSAEGASTLVSDAQAGFGWRKGTMQASLGYVHRDVSSGSDNGFGNVGMQKLSDNMVAFTFSLHGR